jgi:hypothetical protein
MCGGANFGCPALEIPVTFVCLQHLIWFIRQEPSGLLSW